ncbi:hypothetical protein V1512DRAFT_241249 [Lipomyces arxii]|uniref:uncharacterized protein n=1 Tax=Lipomyces arxii TaxID=56418 RepID=UPI0034CD0BE4
MSDESRTADAQQALDLRRHSVTTVSTHKPHNEHSRGPSQASVSPQVQSVSQQPRIELIVDQDPVPQPHISAPVSANPTISTASQISLPSILNHDNYSINGEYTPERITNTKFAEPRAGCEASPKADKTPTGSASPRTIPKTSSASVLSEDHKRSRACDHCRALKVRCVPYDEANTTGTCSRCQKSSRECVFTVNPRKRQKRTDTRVADLEKKLDQLTARLAATHEAEEDESASPASSSVSDQPRLKLPRFGKRGSTDSENLKDFSPSLGQFMERSDVASISSLAELASLRPEELSAYVKAYGSPSRQALLDFGQRILRPKDIEDIIRRYNLSETVMQEALDFFVKHMLPHLPFIYFAPGYKFSDLQKHRPMLSLTIVGLAILNVTKNYLLSNQLTSEVYKLLSEQVLVIGHKTIDLVESLLTVCFWYNPPEVFEFHKAHVLTTCAYSIASAIGINRAKRVRPESKYESMLRVAPGVDTESAECRRLWLALYICSNNVALVFRFSEAIRWTSYLDQCCTVLETANECPEDLRLCKCTRLYRILASIGGLMYAPDSTVAGLGEPRNALMLKIFERDLAEWKEKSLTKPNDTTFLMMYHTAQLYLHEVSLHNTSNCEKFAAPFAEKAMDPDQTILTLSHAEAIAFCITSCHSTLEAFCDGDSKYLCHAPIYFNGRVIYACAVLSKIALTVMRTTHFPPGFSMNMLRPDYYFSRTYRKFVDICADEAVALVTVKFKYVMGKLYLWFHRQMADIAANAGELVDRVPQPSPELPVVENKPVDFNSFIQSNSSTLDMLSTVAMQEQRSSSVLTPAPTRPSSLDETEDVIFMPNSTLAIIQHLEQEDAEEQRQRMASTTHRRSSFSQKENSESGVAGGQGEGADANEPASKQVVMGDEFWRDMLYGNDGQLPGVDVAWLNFQMPFYG